MKYLKRFSLLESVSIDEIKDLVDSTFANLYDNGFEVKCEPSNFASNRNSEKEFIVIKLRKVPKSGVRSYLIDGDFTWNEVKDYYIPFLQLVKRRYDLVSFGDELDDVRIEYVDWSYYSVDDLIEDQANIKENSNIYSITILIKNL